MTNSTTEFTPPHPLNTAVLFLVFNRLDTTKQVFEAIRQAQPPRLYVAADGARETIEGEAKKTQTVRDYIMNSIDWKCEVKTLFRDKNLGCKYAVSGAIDWFFENEEMGIILEDDCLPSQSFFWFCEELLQKYKDDMRVWQISGYNLLENKIKFDASYIFSRYGGIWGWASWKNRWCYYDVEMNGWSSLMNKTKWIDKVTYSKSEARVRVKQFDSITKNRFNTWDYQWVYIKLLKFGLNIIPKTNMIKNLGFDNRGTHTKNPSSDPNLINKDIDTKIIHPNKVLKTNEYEIKYSKKFFGNRNILFRIINKIKRIN